MSDYNQRKTPGVYITETQLGFGGGQGVATAIAAFIGYTPQAVYQGKDYTMTPTQVTSMAEFQSFFMLPDPPPPADPAKQYSPQLYLVEDDPKGDPDSKVTYCKVEGKSYAVVPDPATIYYLYNSVRLFFANGGSEAYIVSVGPYGQPSGKPQKPGEHIINPHVKLSDLLKGVEKLKEITEVTMYICPEATLLSVQENGKLMQAMLKQNEDMQTAISILDVIGGRNPDTLLYTNDIQVFRDNVGTTGLQNGAVYYPFVGTTVMARSEIDYTNLFGGDVTKLAPLINSQNNPTISSILNEIANPPADSKPVSQLNAALVTASSDYAEIMKRVLAYANVLPPSGGMAGVMTSTDNEVGVWKAPAGKSMIDVVSLPLKLDDFEQENLNAPIDGKAINAIRELPGRGILIWGARTLDANSNDWRYVPVRRFLFFIEQSCKLIIHQYVLAANDANTWLSVKDGIVSFLTGVWQEGGLQGGSADAAFQVECGLGMTMTEQDLLSGVIRVSVKVAVSHPAEFIVLTIEQEMAS